jgi:signal peptidase I
MDQNINSGLSENKKKGTWGGFFFTALCFLFFRSFFYSPFKIPSGSMIPTLLVGDHIVTSKFAYGWSRYSLLFSGWINYFSGRVGRFAIKRGDVAVFAFPKNVTVDYVKRVVGLPGEKIQMIAGVLHINDKPVTLKRVSSEPYLANDGERDIEGMIYEETFPGNETEKPSTHLILKQKPFGDHETDDTPPVVLKENEYFCLGDNRDGSSDSRYPEHLGVVHADYFIGPALFIWLSFDTSTSWSRIWMWPFQMRYHRFFNKII